MTRRHVNIGRPIALLGVALLLVSLFLEWFGADARGPGADAGISAWTAFETLDLLLAGIGIAAFAIVLPKLFGRPPLLAEAWLPVLGAAALVIVVATLLNHPPSASQLDGRVGAWLALAGAVLFVVGSLVGHAKVSFSMTFDERDEEPVSQRAPAAPPPPASGEPPTEQL